MYLKLITIVLKCIINYFYCVTHSRPLFINTLNKKLAFPSKFINFAYISIKLLKDDLMKTLVVFALAMFCMIYGFVENNEAAEKKAVTKKKNPVILSTSIANKAKNVDPKIKELIIKFDRSMDTSKHAIVRGKKGFDYLPAISRWNKEGTQWFISLELLPGKDYSFVFPSNFFLDKDGNPTKKSYELDFKTGK